MRVRLATPDDVYREDWRDLVERGLKAKDINQVVSWTKLEYLAFQSLNTGLWLVAETSDSIVAHLGSVITDNQLFEGKQCTVVAWYSEHPGMGWALFRKFEAWVKTQDVKTVVVSTNYDERLDKILKKRGWMMCPSYLQVH